MEKPTLIRMLEKKGEVSPWRELGKAALKTAMNTLIEEGIEAAVEIWKKRRLKIQEELLDERDFSEQTSGAGESSEAEADESTGETDAEAAADESGPRRRPSGRIEKFGDYVEGKP